MTNRWPEINADRTVVWLRDHASDVVDDMIESAFRNVKSFPLKRMIMQFWRPAKTPAGRRVLACTDNPCALTPLNHRLCKYRKRCSKYYYVIDDDLGESVGDPMTITGAPPSTAFRDHFPEVVLDLTVHRGTPLVDLALECELTCFMMLPVFDQTSCVGVIEVSMRLPSGLLVIFNELTRELKRVGLCINPPQPPPRPCKAITGDPKLAISEIQKALQMASQSHAITFGQVWIPYESYHHKTRRTLLGKLISAGDKLSSIKHFYDNVHVLPLKKGEGLVGKTLETHQPHLCRNIYKLSDNNGVLAVLSANTKCTCFVICLRSSHTGELDYAFEFFWPQSCSHLALMEALVMTLREYLPSFKYASGAQLGDELHVTDVENPSSGGGSRSKSIKIFTGNELSETKASVGVNRKHIDLYEGESELNQTDQCPLTNINNDGDDDDDLVILAIYKVDYRLFFLPRSATFENVMEKIKQEFELKPAEAYKIQYQVVPGEWYSLTDDTCLKRCVSSYRVSKNINHIKLGVLAVER